MEKSKKRGSPKLVSTAGEGMCDGGKCTLQGYDEGILVGGRICAPDCKGMRKAY